jgi:hypothetical protein
MNQNQLSSVSELINPYATGYIRLCPSTLYAFEATHLALGVVVCLLILDVHMWMPCQTLAYKKSKLMRLKYSRK